MKLFLTLLFLTLSLFVEAQKAKAGRNLPFEILFAENVRNQAGEQVKTRELVGIDDILTIRDGGFLSMIHYLGYPIEISGDTMIQVRKIQMAFDLLLGGKGNKIYPEKRDIRQLFISDKEAARRNKRIGNGGSCAICDFDMELLYPPKFNGDIFFSGDLCLRWHSTGSKNYAIRLTDIFDDEVASYSSSTNELRIDSAEISTLIDGNSALLVYLKNEKTQKVSMPYRIKQFPSTTIKFPYQCAPQNATDALLIGLGLEMGSGYLSKLAGDYYALAAKLSDRQFFKTMLDNYNKRKE